MLAVNPLWLFVATWTGVAALLFGVYLPGHFPTFRRIVLRLLPVGTRSVLWGAHCWFIHPWFVAAAWWRLYGFAWDPRLWVAFFVHDLGYLFQWCRNMDGPEGERHVEWGAAVMHLLFDRSREEWWVATVETQADADAVIERMEREGWEGVHAQGRTAWHRRWVPTYRWRDLCLYHSRFYAKRDNKPHSRLCVADKLAVCLEPWWLYLPRVVLSGEVWEYLALAGGKNGSKYTGERNSKYVVQQIETGTLRGWHRGMTAYLREWVEAHKDGQQDTWTPEPARAHVGSEVAR